MATLIHVTMFTFKADRGRELGDKSAHKGLALADVAFVSYLTRQGKLYHQNTRYLQLQQLFPPEKDEDHHIPSAE